MRSSEDMLDLLCIYSPLTTPLHSYSANLMKLCVTSRDPLDSTLNKVLHYFSEVGNRNIPPTIFPEDPYPDTLHMVSVKSQTLLSRLSSFS